MLWTMVELSATVFDCFMFVEFPTQYLGWKYGTEKKSFMGFVFGFMTILLTTLVLNRFTLFESKVGYLYTIIIVVYGIFFLNGSIFEKLIAASIINGLKLIISVSLITLFNYLSNYEIVELITYRGLLRLLLILADKAVFFYLTRMILRIQKKNKFALSLTEWLAIFGVFIMSFLAAVLVFDLIMIYPKSNQNDWIAILVVISLIIINILSYYIFITISARNKEKFEYSLKELQLTEQEKSIKEIKASYEEVRKLRHDMKNYVQCAIALLHNEKAEEAKSYLESLLNNKMTFGNQVVFTDSDVLNAVLNSKISLCKQQGISVKYQVSGNVSAIAELDLSILLGNLLDNAIEACLNTDDRKIDLKIYEDRNYLIINIDNSIKESVLSKNPQLISTKEDKLKHGFGTLSIKDIVNQYNGMVNYYEENGHFISDIWLMIPA
ncbi:MAG: Histidine kinase, gyrase and HSP90-like ATPase [Anaerocolumna sp.]|nr:Histidine kinase, gyrase and HSP90-like ATPase [Anaerocolumna sp.]